MLLSLAAASAGFLLAIAILGAVVWALAQLALRIAGARSRAMVGYLVDQIVPLRESDYLNRGLLARTPPLKRQVRREAIAFCSHIQPSAGLAIGASPWDAWLAIEKDASAVAQAVRTIWHDLCPGERAEAGSTPAGTPLDPVLAGMTAGVAARFERIKLWFILLEGIVLAGTFQLDAWRMLASAASGRFDLGWLSGSRVIAPLFAGGMNWSAISGIAAAALSLAAAAFFWDRVAVATSASAPAPAHPRHLDRPAAREEPAPSIGKSGLPVQVLNFAAGGFDTVMQLGVAHALVVIQGRAPDAVVGVSAGALNAVALAEILQAGEEEERAMLGYPADHAAAWRAAPDKHTEIQRMRVAARTRRLHFYIDAAQKGPEELLDSLLPDTYQIESTDPLASLSQPRFAARERRERDMAAIARSGLIRLYNDLLDVNFSVATITRIIRRAVGLKAAGDLQGWKRRAAKFVEGARLAFLLGRNLHRTASLASLLARRLIGKPGATPRTADGLMLGSSLRRLWPYVVNVLCFIALLGVWLAPACVLALLALGRAGSPYPFALLLLWSAGLVLGGLGGAVWFYYYKASERLPWLQALRGMAKGALAYAALCLPWLVLPIAACAGVAGRSLMGIGWWILLVIVVLGAAVAAALGILRLWNGGDQPFLQRLLASYRLNASLLQNHGLRQFLVRLFDENYNGDLKRDSPHSMDTVIAASLESKREGSAQQREPKRVAYYSDAERIAPIHLGLAVANVATGDTEVVGEDQELIQALMAATAWTPWFPPIDLGGKLYVDGANVANEPTRALLALLRSRLNPQSQVVHIYSVSPFPVSASELRKDSGNSEYTSLIDVAFRALLLQRFRDATLERRLTELITRTIPKGEFMMRPEVEHNESRYIGKFFRAWVTPIELDTVRSVNKEVFGASTQLRHSVIREAIADGCRAALQVMIHDEIGAKGNRIQCKRAVDRYRQRPGSPSELTQIELPGKHPDAPGLDEICAHCALSRRDPETQHRTLRAGDWSSRGPSWPHERDYDRKPLRDDPHFAAERPDTEIDKVKAGLNSLAGWPRPRPGPPCIGNHVGPSISFLFSGGVFRGVYQMGVLNALNEIGLEPDVVAGASVGSITAAMVARTFTIPKGPRRAGHIARLAAVYLAIDRLVLTDRFADFIRNLTLRAANTFFSIRQADQYFRKYDYPGPRQYDRIRRCVLAGTERLFWVSPEEIDGFSNALREGDWERVWKDLGRHCEGWLNRMQVGDEVLGAEPLGQLIDEYVAQGIGSGFSRGPLFRDLFECEASRVLLFATATNLTDGRLEVLGLPGSADTMLKEGLLASSAFPGVFRPRWSWEVRPGENARRQYIDGGTMDNLPIDAVARFLAAAAPARIPSRPKSAPHLIVAASLEPALRRSLSSGELDELRNNWRALRGRVGKLNHNTKLDNYARTESILRSLPRNGTIDPIDIHIAAIKPEWLPGTFAFHPMLGFRRESQKRSIAHGCASTLLHFARIDPPAEGAALKQGEGRLGGWNIHAEKVPGVTGWVDAFQQHEADPAASDNGGCWLRPSQQCPFSRPALMKAEPGLPETTLNELSDIWRICSKRETQLQKL